jgi:hypothetical protein
MAQAEDQITPVQQEILKRLQELQNALEFLTKRVEVLERKLKTPKSPTGVMPFMPFSPYSEQPSGALAQIRLPASPTRDQVREYIKAITDATGNPRSSSSTDPQVGMFMKVGAGHADLLIDALGTGRGSRFYLMLVINSLADERHKKLILDRLDIYRSLAEVVVRLGWEKDARIILVRGLNNVSYRSFGQFIPPAWIQAVANLNDPKTYEALLNHFINGQNRSSTYKAICRLPGMDLKRIKGAVETVWSKLSAESASSTHGWEKSGMAQIAVLHGIVDALGYLIHTLAGENRSIFVRLEEIDGLVRSVIPVGGSSQEILEWFRSNRNALQYDEKSKKYFVPGKAKESDSEDDF